MPKTMPAQVALLVCATLSILMPACDSGGVEGPFDLVILNGRVMDPETDFDDVRNVGINDGLIVTITEGEITGEETIDATHTVGENGRPCTGIPYVIVNGTIVVRDSTVVDGVYPGQAIRYPVESEGRFETLERKNHLEKLPAPDLPIDEGIGSAAR